MSAKLETVLLALGVPAVAIHMLSVHVLLKARRVGRHEEAAWGVTEAFPLHSPPAEDGPEERFSLLGSAAGRGDIQ